MTVATTTNKTGSFAAGAGTPPATLPFTFPVFSQDDIQVIEVEDTTLVEHVLTRGTHYTVTLLYAGAGGGYILFDSVNRPAGVLAGRTAYIKRVMDETQEIDLKNQGDWFPDQHEEAFDRAIMLIQQLQEQEDRALHTDNAHTLFDAEGLRITNVGDATDSTDAPTFGQMQTADAAVTSAWQLALAAAVAAATAALNSAVATLRAWVTQQISSAVAVWMPTITQVLNTNCVVPSSQTVLAGQTRVYMPCPIYGIVFAVGGAPQANILDFTYTPGNRYVDLVVAPAVDTICTAFVYTSPLGGAAFEHLTTTLSAFGTAVTFVGETWDQAIVCRGGLVQRPVVDYTTTVIGSDTAVVFTTPASVDTTILVIKL